MDDSKRKLKNGFSGVAAFLLLSCAFVGLMQLLARIVELF